MKLEDKLIKNEIKESEKEKLINLNKVNNGKIALINELKNGLGEEIKKNPNKIKIIKKTFLERVIITLKKIFTKF